MSTTGDAKPAPAPRMVQCKKLGKELPGLTYKPYNNALGQRIYDEISEQAWKMWVETAKMLLNEYRLNLALPQSQKFLFEQAEKFFFGEGAAPPPEFKPR